MIGCSPKTFESHLCEVMWRSWNRKTNVYATFKNSLNKVYSLTEPPKYTVQSPIFQNFWFDDDYDNRTYISVDESILAEVSDCDTDVVDTGNSEDTNINTQVKYKQFIKDCYLSYKFNL